MVAIFSRSQHSPPPPLKFLHNRPSPPPSPSLPSWRRVMDKHHQRGTIHSIIAHMGTVQQNFRKCISRYLFSKTSKLTIAFSVIHEASNNWSKDWRFWSTVCFISSENMSIFQIFILFCALYWWGPEVRNYSVQLK